MASNTFSYLLFLGVVLVAYYLLPQKLRNYALFIASYYFYMQTAPVNVIYMVASTLLTFGSALLSTRIANKRTSDWFLALTIVLNLSCLLVFKYSTFFADIVNGIAMSVGGKAFVPLRSWIAPLGISFYTFQSLGYVIDVYRKKVAPERNIATYAVFISFFPQILSGPIGRADQLLPQFKETHPLRYQNILFGGQRFLWGLFKKAVIADWLGTVVDNIYGNFTERSGLILLAAVVLFALQLYFDFSAYTDMALGAAKMLGFSLLENFRAPLFATNMSDFWKRWHISLTSWFNDYIFTPLVWSRWVNKLVFGKKWQDRAPHFALNILIVFAVSGLWHGASLSFVLWGLLHGAFRVAEEILHKIKKPAKIKNKWLRGVRNTGKRLIVFCLSAGSLVFFRLPTTFQYAQYVFQNLFTSFDWNAMVADIYRIIYENIASSVGFVTFILWVVGAAIALVLTCEYFVIYKAPKNRDNPGNILQHVPAIPRWICYVFILASIVAVGVFGSSSFVYFNF